MGLNGKLVGRNHLPISLHTHTQWGWHSFKLYGVSMKVDFPVGELKNVVAFVSTGKCPAKVMCTGEYEKFKGVNFTILVFSIFNTS